MSRAGATRLAIILAALALWQAVGWMEWRSPIVLASPVEIMVAAARDGAAFLDAIALTVGEIAAAVAIAWTLGIGTGLLAGSRPGPAEAIGPVLSSMFALPLIILYPLFLAWVGIGPASKILFGVVSGYFPIALNTLSGVRRVDPQYAVMARAMGASRRQIFFKVVVLLALPSIVSGLRVGTGMVVIGVVVTEMLASVGGVGFLISWHGSMFHTGQVYLGILLALIVALLINWGLTAAERYFGRWAVAQRRTRG